MAAKAAMVRLGVGAPGEPLLQLTPVQPDGAVGVPSVASAVGLTGKKGLLRSACGMKPPSTTAARTTTRDKRQRTDIVVNFRGADVR
jgi:hypothetical protein